MSKIKITDKLMRMFLYASLVIIGIVIGIIIRHFHNITISEEINLIDMATLVVTVFLAVYIPSVLDQRLQSNKEKQDLLENRINDYQALVRRINMLVQSINKLSENEFLTVQNLIDISQHRLKILNTLIKNADLERSFDDDMRKIIQLNNAHRELLLSESTGEGGFSYPEDIKQKEEDMYNRLEESTSLLILDMSSMK